MREIARRTGHSRNTVARYLRCDAVPRYTPRPPVAGKLEPHEAWLAEQVHSVLPGRLSAVVLLRELRGYTGGIAILREHPVQPHRARSARWTRIGLRFSNPPRTIAG